MNEVVYFELNNWFSGRDYPEGEPFETWVEEESFFDNEWCKRNRLCVVAGFVDMSFNWCIAAPKEWVIENCPKLLSQETYEYETIMAGANADGEIVEKTISHTESYSNFLRWPEEDGIVYGRFGWEFSPYCEENFGVHFHND